MGQFRVLDAADVCQILGAFGLSAATYLGHEPIAAGTINTNVRIETSVGRRFLRINEGKSADEVAREAAIVSHVAMAGVPTPVPYPDLTTGQPYVRWHDTLVSLFPWVPGRILARANVTAHHAAQVGRALGRLHKAGTTFPDHRPGRYEPAEIGSRVERIGVVAATQEDPLLNEALGRLRPELDSVARDRRTDLPTGLIHGDLFVDNVLFEEEIPREDLSDFPRDGADGPSPVSPFPPQNGDAMVALLDFEQASWGRLAYDLAVTTLAFGFGRDDFRRDVVRALFDGYAAERPPDPAERAGFGPELRFVACRFAVTRITDVYLKRGAGAAPGKDFRRYLQRLTRVHEHLRAGDGLFILPG